MRNLIANIDFWGFTTSFLCAIHCAVLPIFLSLGFISSQTWMLHPAFEFIMIALTVLFVYNSLIKGFFKNKVNSKSFIMAVVGLLMIVFHHFVPAYNISIVVTGGFLVALAHFNNLLSTKRILIS